MAVERVAGGMPGVPTPDGAAPRSGPAGLPGREKGRQAPPPAAPSQQAQGNRAAIAHLRRAIAPTAAHAEFSVSDSGVIQVRVVDNQSGSVIRVIPPDQLVALADQLAARLKGILVDKAQ